MGLTASLLTTVLALAPAIDEMNGDRHRGLARLIRERPLWVIRDLTSRQPIDDDGSHSSGGFIGS